MIMYQYRDYHFPDYSIVHVKHSFIVWNIPIVLFIPLLVCYIYSVVGMLFQVYRCDLFHQFSIKNPEFCS